MKTLLGNKSNGPLGMRSHANGFRAASFFLPENEGGALLKITEDGRLLFANQAAQELLSALGWSRQNPLPDPLIEPARQALAVQTPLRTEVSCGELAFSFIVSPWVATKHVNFFGTRVGGSPPGLTPLLEALPNFIWTTDPSGKALYVNKRWRVYTGLTLRELNEFGWARVCHPRDLPRLKALWSGANVKSTVSDAELRFRAQDGTYRWFLNRWVPNRDSRGRVILWVGTSTDIHARKTAEAAYRRAQTRLRRHTQSLERVVAERTEQLRKSLAETQAFAESVAHDLRAPLRAVVEFAKAELRDRPNALESPAGNLQRIVHEAERMQSFVNALLDFGKLSHRSLDLQPLDVLDLIRQLVRELPQFQPPLAQIELPDSSAMVRGDLASLAQCVTNLLGNAVKFVNPGTLPHVRIHNQPNGTHVRIVFEDDGIGIPKEDLPAIFAPFQRAAGTQYEGHGLGLAIVQRAVARMNGRVGAESNAGKGSRFWVELPKA